MFLIDHNYLFETSQSYPGIGILACPAPYWFIETIIVVNINCKQSCMVLYQIKSLQWEQNVGCRKNVAMNLCPLTWWTRRRMAPRRRFKPWRSLNSRGFSLLVLPQASVKIRYILESGKTKQKDQVYKSPCSRSTTKWIFPWGSKFT